MSSWRESTRTEIQTYYRREFPQYLERLPDFLTPDGPQQFALAFDERYPVRGSDVPPRDFIRRDTWETTRGGAQQRENFPSQESLLTFIQLPADADPLGGRSGLADPAVVEQPRPIPKAVYYSLEHWDRSWILLVDIDAKDVAEERIEKNQLGKATLEATPPAGYPYAFEDIERAIEYGFEVERIFTERLNATETMVVYTGQGAHVYLLDDDRHHRYDAKSRELLNDLLETTYEIPIDPVVTADRRRVARLPYSLHTDVSRIAQPIESPEFDFRTEAQPDFLESHD